MDKLNKILVIDDESSNIIALKKILETDYKVYAEIDSLEAINTVEETTPDIILLDILMPEMDGYQVISELKASAKTRDIPVVFITGLDNTDAEEKGFALGAADYIQKPFHPAIVRVRVKNQIKILDQLRQQALMTKISHKFLSDANEEVLFKETLKMIGEFMNLKQLLLYEIDDSSNDLICKYEWFDLKHKTATHINEKFITDAHMKSYITGILTSGELCIHSNDQTHVEAAKRFRSNSTSFITTPVFVKGRLCAALDFTKEDDGQYWSASELDLAVLVSGVLSSVYERNAMERRVFATEYRDKMLQAANEMAILLLNTYADDFENVIHEGMSLIADATSIDCVYLWKNNTIDGKLFCTQIFEWSPKKTVFADSTPYYYDEVVPGWEETLSSGNYINKIVREMSKKEQEHLSPGGILSVLVIPIFIDNKFWGFVGFDDCREERIFTSEEESILHSASLLIANSYVRNEMLHEIIGKSAELEIAIDLANIASKAKSDFLANMSHEMRTPLNAIIGMTLIGKRTDEPEKKADALDKISDASSHLLGIVNDILDMAKIEADVLELVEEEFDFKSMLDRVLSIAQFRADEKQHTLSVDVDKRIPQYVIGDDQRLAQVITNLLENAVKFTNDGGKIDLNVSLSEKTEDHCELKINISDNGIGISPEQLEKLFDAFEQADNSTVREHGGTGLGLSISKRLIERMGGSIWVESEFGTGSSFIFTIKVKHKESGSHTFDKEGADGTDPLDAIVSEGTFTGKRLLVAEDAVINREILIALLEGSGFEIDCAENGKIAVDMVSSDHEKYDIVFMDLQMPHMGGLEATKLIRALPARKRKELPIVAMTANVFQEDIDACMEAGMNGHLGKPLDLNKVFDVLKEHVN